MKRTSVGLLDGDAVGFFVGSAVGCSLGVSLGTELGEIVGIEEGGLDTDGLYEGLADGIAEIDGDAY